MKNILLIFCVMLSACTTAIPISRKFPDLPPELNKPCPPLQLIEGDSTTLSKLMDTVAKNYGSRHECAAQLNSILLWHAEQKANFKAD